ncbi:hypothetical protein [Paenibacillus sp. TSA_86.1]|uniref:hypothetical protein n=1 Tax=Paenibacillus sp. TSA_86.1 TaxID=3415649 RepID=UPI0040458618
MMDERILHMFTEAFKEYSKLPIALYGLGVNTKKILELGDTFNFVGIVANDRVGEIVYGREVLSIESVVDKAEIIIIVSQMKSVKAIYQRIRDIEEYGLEIYDLTGNQLTSNRGSEFQEDPYWELNSKLLKEHIDRSDIVSFDLWDTLVMRKVLNPALIFSVVEQKMNIVLDDLNFKQLRTEAEQLLLNEGKVPTLTEIYQLLQKKHSKLSSQVCDQMMELEVLTEMKYSIQRESVVHLLNYAKERGKQIYFLFETTLTAVQVSKLLESCSILDVAEAHIVISSEVNKTTQDGSLFAYFNEISGSGKKMFIGNRNAHLAKEHNIDAHFLANSYEMFSKSSINHIIDQAITLNDNIILGLFASKAFNDPFALSSSKGKMKIDNLYELGYYCFTALTLKFLTWLIEKHKDNSRSIVLFASRDGYFLHQLYQKIRNKYISLELPVGIYFYTSRRALTVASIYSEADIINIVRSVLTLSVGKLNKILEQRLGVTFDDQDKVLNCELINVVSNEDSTSIINRVLDYKLQILSNAQNERENYLKYINKIVGDDYSDNYRLYLFDLYTKGTSYYHLNKLLSAKVELVCFDLKDHPNEFITNSDSVHRMYKESDKLSFSFFERVYQLFEVAYASSEGQLRCFDSEGNPEFIENSEYKYNEIKTLQRGIIDFMSDLEHLDEDWYLKSINLNMTDSFAEILDVRKTVMSPTLSKGFSYYDSFASEDMMNIWENTV